MPQRDQQWLIDMQDGSLFHSLQKGQGKSSGSNPCGNVPGQSKGICSRKIAGNIVRAPPPLSNPVMDIAVASSIANEADNKQHQTS
uniref:Uncharacterized protein n=3 Tax=Manihot esculenta TaxID=3983 RepID=A0A2C9WMH7_MANES